MSATCIYRPRVPRPTMNPPLPAVATSGALLGASAGVQHAAAASNTQCYNVSAAPVRKNCGFPWWLIFLFLGLIVLGLLWAWLRNRDPQQPTTTNNANGNGPINTAANVTRAAAAGVAGTAQSVWQQATDPFRPDSQQQQQNGQQRQQQYQQNWQQQQQHADSMGGMNRMVKTGRSQTIRDHTAAHTPALFMFTMDGCDFCIECKPELQKVAQYANIDVYEVPRVNLEKPDLARGYPYFFLLLPDGKRVPYQGKRCAQDLLKFIQGHLGDQAVNTQYQNELTDCGTF